MALVVPIGIKTPEQVIDEHADIIASIAKRLIRENAELVHREARSLVQLGDALDRVFELETKLRERDNVIDELRELAARRGAR